MQTALLFCFQHSHCFHNFNNQIFFFVFIYKGIVAPTRQQKHSNSLYCGNLLTTIYFLHGLFEITNLKYNLAEGCSLSWVPYSVHHMELNSSHDNVGTKDQICLTWYRHWCMMEWTSTKSMLNVQNSIENTGKLSLVQNI